MIRTMKCGHEQIIVATHGVVTPEDERVFAASVDRTATLRECFDCREQHRYELECRQTAALEAIAECLLNPPTAQGTPEPAIPPTEKPRCSCTDNPCSCRGYQLGDRCPRCTAANATVTTPHAAWCYLA